jgi:hypothetical protein
MDPNAQTARTHTLSRIGPRAARSAALLFIYGFSGLSGKGGFLSPAAGAPQGATGARGGVSERSESGRVAAFFAAVRRAERRAARPRSGKRASRTESEPSTPSHKAHPASQDTARGGDASGGDWPTGGVGRRFLPPGAGGRTLYSYRLGVSRLVVSMALYGLVLSLPLLLALLPVSLVPGRLAARLGATVRFPLHAPAGRQRCAG